MIHFYYDIDEWELYDLESDPQEMKNVYDDGAYAEIKEQLKAQLIQLAVMYKDSI